jgi:hypothetical protein
MRLPPCRRLSAAASATGEAATSQTDYRDRNPAVAAGNKANPKSEITNKYESQMENLKKKNRVFPTLVL